MVLSSLSVILRNEETLKWKEIVATFAFGLLLGIPLCLIESYNPELSEIWFNFISAVWLYICWQMSFAIGFKRMKLIIAKVEEMKEESEYKSTEIWKVYMRGSYYFNLYAVALWTSFFWVLFPFPEIEFFWLSQIVLDVFFFAEFGFCVGLSVKSKVFEEDLRGVTNEEMQLNLMRDELEEIE
jgi:hypothetical protein